MLLSVERTPKFITNHNFAPLLLKKMFLSENPSTSFPEICISKTGKPFFEDSPWFFNISHSKEYVAVALHHCDIGVDIQVLHTPSPRLLQRVCSKSELLFLSHSQNLQDAFPLLWVGKESYFKEDGSGIGSGRKLSQIEILPTDPHLPVQQNKILNKHLLRYHNENFSLGLCCQEELPPIEWYHYDP